VVEEMQHDKGYGKKDLEERKNSKKNTNQIPNDIMEDQSMQFRLPQSPGDKYGRNEG